MSQSNFGTLSAKDRAAFLQTSSNLGLDPYEFGALVHQESGFNPNIVGGEGGNYYGLIQFGIPERTEAGLDPKKIGNYTIAEQMPHVEKWLRGRGFKTGMGIDQAYATILAGNPNANMNSQDSFGTSVNSSVPKFLEGGSLNQAACKTLGDVGNASFFAGPQLGQADGPQPTKPPAQLGSTTGLVEKPEFERKKSLAEQLRGQMIEGLLSGQGNQTFFQKMQAQMPRLYQ